MKQHLPWMFNSESIVQEALDRACHGRTVLVIAHRLSTIKNAHQIALLHKGTLQEVRQLVTMATK